MTTNNGYVDQHLCDAITKRLDGRIDDMGNRVEAMDAGINRRFGEMAAWVKEVAEEQKWGRRMQIATAIGAIGSLLGIVIQLLTKAG